MNAHPGSNVKGPLKYLVAKLRLLPIAGANSLPVSQNVFARFFRRRPVADLSRCLTFTSLQQTQKAPFDYIFIDCYSLRLQHVSGAFIF